MATKLEYYTANLGTASQINSTNKAAQTFSHSSTFTPVYVKVLASRQDLPGNLHVGIQAVDESGNPDGNDIFSGYASGDDWTEYPPGEWVTVTFTSPIELAADTTYALVFTAPDAVGGDPAKGINLWNDFSGATYPNGDYFWYSGSWAKTTGRDFGFELWGDEYVFTPPNSGPDITQIKRIVAAANNKIWYEDI